MFEMLLLPVVVSFAEIVPTAGEVLNQLLVPSGVKVTVTIGATLSGLYVTWLSKKVAAALGLPALSVATPALTFAITVPVWLMPVTETSNVVPLFGAISATAADVASAVPDRATSPVTNVPAVSSLKTTVNRMGPALAGSACPIFWLMVTVGAIVSIVKLNAPDRFETFPAASVAVALIVCGPLLSGPATVAFQLPPPLTTSLPFETTEPSTYTLTIVPVSPAPAAPEKWRFVVTFV